MNTIKAVVALLISASASFPQDIIISGIVTDTGTTPLSSAAVKLEKYGLTDTTGADGKFTLTGAVGIHNSCNNLNNHTVSARISHGILYLDIRERVLVEVITYTLRGQAVSRVKKVMAVGTHRVSHPNAGQGVYIFRIKTYQGELVIKSPLISITSVAFAKSSSVIKSPAIQANRFSFFEDTIKVTKKGYLNFRIAVTNPETSDVVTQMINQDAGTVTDIDGNTYTAIRIGNQIWTVENLRTTKFNDGTDIPNVTVNISWGGLHTPGYCFWENSTDPAVQKKWGALYNWYAVNTGKLAPNGWRVPTKDDWIDLGKYLTANGYNWDGTTSENKAGKSIAATTDWRLSSYQGAVGNDIVSNNSSGFSALPGSNRHQEGYFDLRNWGRLCTFWCDWEGGDVLGWGRYLGYNSIFLNSDYGYKKCGYSVRLVRDLD